MAKHYAIKAYHNHKRGAVARGVGFLLTFAQWKDIWERSGCFAERGRGPDKYCMARHGDVGPYAVGNVRIITNRENRSEQKLSDEGRRKMRAAKLGHRLSQAHRDAIGAAHNGRVDSPEVRQRKSASKSGHLNPMFGRPIPPDVLAKQVAARAGYRHSDETKKKISDARKRYREQRR